MLIICYKEKQVNKAKVYNEKRGILNLAQTLQSEFGIGIQIDRTVEYMTAAQLSHGGQSTVRVSFSLAVRRGSADGSPNMVRPNKERATVTKQA